MSKDLEIVELRAARDALFRQAAKEVSVQVKYEKKHLRSKAHVEQLEECLRAIRDYKPKEIVYDEFAYKRMVGSYREAAREGLKRNKRRTKKAVDCGSREES